MSVVITLRVAGDASKLEEFAAANPELLPRVAEIGRASGALKHQFYASEDGKEVLVIDEWSSKVAFDTFFKSVPEIENIIGSVAKGEPSVAFWTKLELGDTVD